MFERKKKKDRKIKRKNQHTHINSKQLLKVKKQNNSALSDSIITIELVEKKCIVILNIFETHIFLQFFRLGSLFVYLQMQTM